MEISPKLQERFDAASGLSDLRARDLTPEKVHLVRVSSRRLRALAEVLAQGAQEPSPTLSKAAKALKSLARLMGQIREHDVLERVIKEKYREFFPEASKRLRKQALESRNKRVKKALRKLDTKMEKRIGSLRRQIEGMTESHLLRSFHLALAHRQEASESALEAYHKDHCIQRLHEYRIAVKKWRYVTELAELYGLKPAIPAQSLRTLQDQLGRSTDQEAAIGLMESLEVKKAGLLMQAMRSDLDSLMKEALAVGGTAKPAAVIRKHMPLRMKDHATAFSGKKQSLHAA